MCIKKRKKEKKKKRKCVVILAQCLPWKSLAKILKPRFFTSLRLNRPRLIYQYSKMAPSLSGQTSIFGVVFFVSKSLFGIEKQTKLENNFEWKAAESC